MTPPPVPGNTQSSNTRLTVHLQWHLRSLAGLGAVGVLVYGAALGWRTEANGVATAAAFAVGSLFAIIALAGVVPSNIKVGDVEVKLDEARESGIHEGHAEGLAAGAAISGQVAAGDLPVDHVTTALRIALNSPEPLRVDGIHLPIAQLAPAEAEVMVQQVREALGTVAKESARAA
jgi:hypothetical protein